MAELDSAGGKTASKKRKSLRKYGVFKKKKQIVTNLLDEILKDNDILCTDSEFSSDGTDFEAPDLHESQEVYVIPDTQLSLSSSQDNTPVNTPILNNLTTNIPILGLMNFPRKTHMHALAMVRLWVFTK